MFDDRGENARYCSRRCQTDAYRARRKAAAVDGAGFGGPARRATPRPPATRRAGSRGRATGELQQLACFRTRASTPGSCSWLIPQRPIGGRDAATVRSFATGERGGWAWNDLSVICAMTIQIGGPGPSGRSFLGCKPPSLSTYKRRNICSGLQNRGDAAGAVHVRGLIFLVGNCSKLLLGVLRYFCEQ